MVVTVAMVAFDCTEKMTGKRWAGLLGEVDGRAGPLWPGFPFFFIPEISQFQEKERRREEQKRGKAFTK